MPTGKCVNAFGAISKHYGVEKKPNDLNITSRQLRFFCCLTRRVLIKYCRYGLKHKTLDQSSSVI